MTLEKAKIRNLTTNDVEPVTVQFNPTELTFNKTAQFSETAIPGLDSPVLQFIHGGSETFSMELFFDTTDSGMGENAVSVTTLVKKFYQLVKQNPETHAPPICQFLWGEMQWSELSVGEAVDLALSSDSSEPHQFNFIFVVESIERKFLLFSSAGKPLRARLIVRMKEYQTIEQMVSNLQSADHTRARVLKRQERLEQLSNQLYDNPTEWRRIAEANDIDDPRRIPPGTTLNIPPFRPQSVFEG